MGRLESIPVSIIATDGAIGAALAEYTARGSASDSDSNAVISFLVMP